MEMKTFSMISIEVKIEYDSKVDDEGKRRIPNRIINGLKGKLVPYNIDELINQNNTLKLKFKLKNGARCAMTEPKLLIDKMIMESLGPDKEVVTYTIDVESEELDVKPE
ncbi:hypothetical protein [Clostridium beijerinckii]|uniref:hypothetical protein n=1 Tax=Clostridium beijerinckii TaxID=1520 RepID=UPI00232D2972|nr:hypothetical protein [Clostridium beijerinckii]